MKFGILITTLTVLAAPAGAVTLNFDGVPPLSDPQVTTIVEQGVTISATGGDLGYDLISGVIHLDHCCTPFAIGTSFTTGGVFSAISVDLIGLMQNSFVIDDLDPTVDPTVPVPHVNVLFEGMLGGALVASASISTGLAGGPLTHSFGAGFGAVDMLRITNLDPAGQTYNGLPIECSDYPCGHFEIDGLTLAPVPLPAGVVLAGSGLALLAMLRRRYR